MKEKNPVNLTSEATVLRWLIFVLNLLCYLLTSLTHLYTHTLDFMPGVWELVFPTVLASRRARVALWS